MSDHAPSAATAVADPHADHGHDDPMSHVPPGSIWPLVTMFGLIPVPFGVLSVLGAIKTGPLSDRHVGMACIGIGALVFIYALMSWCAQIIREKRIAHDVAQQQKDLQLFLLLFLSGELAAFGAIFGFYYHRNAHDALFGPLPGMEFGGPLVVYATFFLLSSSVTCEIAHHLLEHGKVQLSKFFFVFTLVLGGIFLAMTGYEWGELMQRGFMPKEIADHSASAFAAIFYTGTGFHAIHVATGLAMLFLVTLRLEAGHFRGVRTFAATAASWYWHFVDIVWVILFMTVYGVK